MEKNRKNGNHKTRPLDLVGDFNEILSNQEKKGGRLRDEKYFQDF